MKSTSDGTDTGRRLQLGVALSAAAIMAVVLVIAGCTSDPPNLVGTALVTDQIDTVLVELEAANVTNYSALRVENPLIPVHRQQLVYMGEQMGTRSNIIANFDFGFSEETVPRNETLFPDSLFTVENIKSVRFSLIKPNFYHASRRTVVDGDTIYEPTGQPVDLYYEIRQLEAAYDSTHFESAPNEVPAFQAQVLNQDFFEVNDNNEPFLRMYVEDFVRWFDEGLPMGLMVTLGASSDSGLVGYGSRETKKFLEFDDLQVGTLVGPNFQVEFQNDYVDTNKFYLMNSYTDASTFDQVPDPPADVDTEFLLRTGLRSYPTLKFDLSGLPPNAFINRALLSITNNDSISFGTQSPISVLEWDETFFGDPFGEIDLNVLTGDFADYQYYSFYVTGNPTQDPQLDETIQFDVTQAVLRVINNVYSGSRGFILAGAEDAFPVSGRSATSADFYYREFRFKGTAAADPAHRPRLKITYSVVDEIQGEGK